ncbi:MAG TPA: asparagine synthase-related protein [Anaerolineae bacterium]|nr:asparagine synthase-related protein [Anaerolineae bacterium]
MPGLVGIVSIGGRAKASLIAAMRSAIKHQDWYQIDDYTNCKGTVAISRVHLGIFNRDSQPYSAQGGAVKVFLHGEIFNDEVIHSDPLDFIYRLYKKQGLDFASFLNGSFVVVIIDDAEDAVLIANDRLGSKPLFYYSDGQATYFSPELKSLLLVPCVGRKFNLAAAADFLANGHFTREHTLIAGLETLDSATVVKITIGGVVRHKYWQYELETDGKDRGHEYYREALTQLLRQAVNRRLRTDNTYGVLLSGGYDSRGILGCYLETRHNQPLHTVSWGEEEDVPESDCAIAKQLAHRLGAQHRFYKLSAEDVIHNFHEFIRLGEGLTWYPENYAVFQRIREQQGIDIVLRGDECFGWEGLMVHDERAMFRALFINTLQDMRVYQRILRPSHYQSFSNLSVEMLHQLSSRCHAKNLHNRKDFFYLTVRLKYLLAPLNYVKTFALESFTPLLDYDLLDFVSTLPVHYRLSKQLYRQTIVGMFPDLFADIARRRNDIDWAAAFGSCAALQCFVYRELIEQPNAMDAFINTAGLRSEIEALFTPVCENSAEWCKPRPLAKSGAMWLRERSPLAFNIAHRANYTVHKWLGKNAASFPSNRAILRLLILKVWTDVFLNYRVARISD